MKRIQDWMRRAGRVLKAAAVAVVAVVVPAVVATAQTLTTPSGGTADANITTATNNSYATWLIVFGGIIAITVATIGWRFLKRLGGR